MAEQPPNASPAVAPRRHPRHEQAFATIYRPRPPETTFPRGAKRELYDVAARVIGDCPLTYLEFGVARGWSIAQIASRFPHPGARFVGFDSFEGLPERWSTFEPGKFSTGGATPETNDWRIGFVKGWFQNSVPGFLSQRRISGPVLIHFDADLYSSTLFLLTTLWHHIPEYFFLFDEFGGDEIIAMHDFKIAYPFAFEFVACTLAGPERPEQIFGRLKNVEFKPPNAPDPPAKS